MSQESRVPFKSGYVDERIAHVDRTGGIVKSSAIFEKAIPISLPQFRIEVSLVVTECFRPKRLGPRQPKD